MKAIIVAGLGFGDEGKGTITDFLVRQHSAKLVVRYNGGPQAAHHVVTSDGRTHCFSQFGAGTLAGAATHLSRFMFIDPLAIIREADHLREIGVADPFALLTIDPDAYIITPYHVAMNQLREILRGDQRHGSCGRGVGELAADIHNQEWHILSAYNLWQQPTCGSSFVTAGRIRDRFMDEVRTIGVPRDSLTAALLDKLEAHPTTWLPDMQERLAVCQLRLEQTSNVLRTQTGTVIFEGAQGVLLDEKHGFAPHTTWSNCTFDNAFTLLHEAKVEPLVKRVGVLRSYATRHGAGPFPTESSDLNHLIADDHNQANRWQGALRAGHFDLPLARYAVQACSGVDELAITYMDKFVAPWSVATGYEGIDALISSDDLSQVIPKYQRVESVDGFIELVTSALAPVTIESWGPTAADKVLSRVAA
jgi:adenylosuccinate synthase